LKKEEEKIIKDRRKYAKKKEKEKHCKIKESCLVILLL